MASVFDLDNQQGSTDGKIVVALERISEAFRVMLWNESKQLALSPIQLQILIFILYHEERMCKIGYLAQEFNLTKATVSDSVKVLLQRGLVEKVEDGSDGRSHALRLTLEGQGVAKRAAGFAAAMELPLGRLSPGQKEVLYQSLLTIMQQLHASGVIGLQRMCLTCKHYVGEGGHYCELLAQALDVVALRVDCPEHLQR